MLPFIDIHTHHRSPFAKGCIEIYNAFLNKNQGAAYYSVGIHPWYIHREEDQIGHLNSLLANDKDILAIGECGLDYAIETPKEIQMPFFQAQINFAEKFKKPLIIHCVKAFDDLIALKKQNKGSQAWIIHGYNKSPELASTLINHGFYLSIGSKLCNNKRLEDILKSIPLERLFFETDNDEKNTIEDIYEQSVYILELSMDDLKKKIEMNFNIVFNDGRPI